MAETKLYNSTSIIPRAPNLLFPVAVLWGVVVIAILTYFAYSGVMGGSSGKYYLLPWCFLTGVVVASPAIVLLFKDDFDPFHPLVFPAWSYFLPAFFIGGILLAFGIVEPYYLVFVEDERYNLPLTFVYIMLGYAGLIAGFSLPIGRRIGARIASWLPVWNWRAEDMSGPGLILLGLGLANTILAFTQGLIGFQKVEERGIFDGIVYLLSMFWVEASLVLWLYIFRSKKLATTQYIIIGTLLLTSFARSVFQGNRGMFITTFIMIAFAYVLSGRKISKKMGAIGGTIAVIAVVFGMIYGTTFRSIKQDQGTMELDKYADVVTNTFEKVGDRDLGANLTYGFTALGERLESVSALAVIVSNYEKLAPYEELYGINDNIWNDTAIFFIPRIIWPNKPVGIEPSKYADLYFNFSENAFTMTPIGDLLRNFGPYGVPLGMLILGILIRIFYSALQENQEFSFWRAALYYMLLTSISYEGTYGLIVPSIFKVGFVSILGIIIIRFFVGSGRKTVN
jgi:hypothetical protein